MDLLIDIITIPEKDTDAYRDYIFHLFLITCCVIVTIAFYSDVKSFISDKFREIYLKYFQYDLD